MKLVWARAVRYTVVDVVEHETEKKTQMVEFLSQTD